MVNKYAVSTIVTLIGLTSVGQALADPAAEAPLEEATVTTNLDASNTCYQVSADESSEALYVMSEPSAYSQVLYALPVGRTVEAASSINIASDEDWMQIIEPTTGYIPANYLENCQAIAEVNNNEFCHQLAFDNGDMYVYSSPNRYGEIVGNIAPRERVIVNEFVSENWAYLEEPVEGYFASEYLAPCN